MRIIFNKIRIFYLENPAYDNYYHYQFYLDGFSPMFVCICENITCTDVRDAVDQGARSIRDLNKELAVGKQCGKCVCAARKVMQEHLAESDFDLAVSA